MSTFFKGKGWVVVSTASCLHDLHADLRAFDKVQRYAGRSSTECQP